MENGSIQQVNGEMLHTTACYIREPIDFTQAAKLIARACYRGRGVFAYQAFEYINAAFFDDRLPCPLLVWQITAHGKCLGFTLPRPDRQPVIALHPSLLGGREKENPWNIDPALLGLCYAYEVLLHECIHVSVEYLLGGAQGPTSHNCPQWIAEVNRLAPMIGLAGVRAEQSKTKRVPIAGELTKRGKQPTKVMRVSEGNVPFASVTTFPYGLRQYFGELDFYRQNTLPFELDLQGETL